MENLNKPLNEELEQLQKEWEAAHKTTVDKELNKASEEKEKR